MPVGDYSTNPTLNTSISGIDIGEGCVAGNMNDALRRIMADIRVWTDAQGVTYPISVANGGTGANTAAGALTALGAFPAAGGTISGAVTIKANLTRAANGIHPYFASSSMTGGRIHVQASGADPTANPGDIVFEY